MKVTDEKSVLVSQIVISQSFGFGASHKLRFLPARPSEETTVRAGHQPVPATTGSAS
jgi:hypothetical protein